MADDQPAMARELEGPEPLVTIGLPVYNGADHLGLALDCLPCWMAVS
jgi:hypothetical protein